MKWHDFDVTCGFGGSGEETQRFGPRQETGSSLYQVDTVATISNKGEDVPGLPWILSAGCMEKVAVVVENNILLFEDCCSSELCSFSAEGCVDALSWSEDGIFLVFVDRSGCLSIAHVPTEQVLLTLNLVKNHNSNGDEKCFSSIILSNNFSGTYDLIVATSEGTGFRFSGVDLEKLDKAVNDRDIELTQQIQQNLKLYKFNLDECNSYVESVSLTKNFENDQASLLVAGEGDFPLNQWVLDSDEVTLTDVCTHVFPEAGFKKCLESPDGLYLIMLDTTNQISLWSRQSLCLLDSWDKADVEDFILFLTSSVETDSQKKNVAKEDLKIVVLTVPDNGKRDLMVLSLPNFEHVYTLKVPMCALLANLPIQQENIMFLVGEQEKGETCVDNIHVKCLMEAIPQNRFSRLLHSKKFNEAEKFAEMFDLDSQLVYHVKSNHILDQLAPWGSNSSNLSNEKFSELMTQLKACMDKINDMERVVKYCLCAQLPSLDATYDLLNYAREKVRVYLETRKFTKSSDLFQELLCGINRLVTFETAFGSTHFNGTTWSNFLSSSLLDEVIKCFISRNINSAFVVWRRHQNEFESDFDMKELNAVLNSIPDNTPSGKLIPWLRGDFVPFVLTVFPEGQCVLADWLEKTARRLEFSSKEKEHWPDNALEMAEVMFTAFSSVTKSSHDRDVATPAQFATKICKLSIPYIDNTEESEDGTSHASAMKKLGKLVKSLREVHSLHHNYNCKLSLDQFNKEDSSRIVFHLLDRIAAAELIPQTMKKYVRPYILKNNLKTDELLYNYTALIVDSKTQMASLWEPKIIAIINEIENKETRCEATLKLMLHAKTPWSYEVETLISSEMKANPDNERLQRQFQFANLRKMMDGYGIRETNLADTSKIQAVIRYMFTTDNGNALEDAFQIGKHFMIRKSFVYCEQIQYWIQHDDLISASKLLPQILKEDLRNLIPYLINWVLCLIEWDPLDDADKNDYIKITHAVVVLSTVAMKLDQYIQWENSSTIDDLRNINCLQKEFNLFISHENYCDTIKKKELIQSFLDDPSKYKSTFAKDRKLSKVVCSFQSRLKRFTELLGFDSFSFYEQLIDMYKVEGNLEKIYDIICELLQDECTSSNHVSLIHKAVSSLLFTDLSSMNTSWVKMINNIYDCACKSLASCAEDDLSDYLILAKLLRVMNTIALECESVDYQEEVKDVGLMNWIEDFYKDNGLVISSVDVYPLLLNVACMLFPEPTEKLLKYESACLRGKGPFVNRRYVDQEENVKCNVAIVDFVGASRLLVDMLRENNHQELAFHIMMLSVSVCSQRYGSLQIGINVLPDEDSVLQETNYLTETELKFSKIILSKGVEYVSDICNELVKLILSHRVIDHDLAVTYLDVFSNTDGQQIIVDLQSRFKNKFSRIQNIAKVGADFAALHDNQKFKENCNIHKECAYWGRKLQLLRVEQACNIFKAYSDEGEKKRIIELLVQQKSIDLKAIIQFCQFFNYDEEEATFMYIENCVLPLDQNVVAAGDNSYQEKIDQCDLSMMNNIKKLENLFHSMVKRISSYDYERLTFIFKKIAGITDSEETQICAEENVRLLDMLSMYKRTSSDMSTVSCNPMDDFEDEQIFDSKVSTVSQEIACHRLPFHPLAKNGITWTVLKPELTSEKNVILLKPIVNKLKFKSDEMFSQAVRMIASKDLAKSNTSTFNFSLVENILGMIEDHAVMMSTAKWLVINLPTGNEKARVLKSIVDRATLLIQNSSNELLENAKILYQKFNELYKKTSYEAALMDYGITDQVYFRCSGAAKLIIQLYEDFGDKVKFDTGRFVGAPDIHALAKRIADISETVDLERIHLYLTNKWLPWKRVSSGNDDDDIDASMLSSNKEDIKKDNEKNLRRVIYLLASSYHQSTIRTLLAAVYQETEGSNITNMCRIRALQVLFTLVDSHSVEIESNLDTEEILKKLVSCMYLSELESLHVSHSEESFKKANKENLVKGLWRNHSHEPQGIRLIADICLDFQIFDPQLWNSLLLKLMSFNKIAYLTHILPPLSGVPQLQEIPSLTKVWKAVITAPYQSVSIPLSAEEEASCLRSAHLITRCPVILDIDLVEIANLMKKVGLHMQALFCMKLCPDKKLRKESIHTFLDDVGVDDILSKIKKDRDLGIMDTHLDAVEEEVFDYVNEHSLYLKLFGTAFFDSLIEYLIQSGKVNNLLVKLISVGKVDYAYQLLVKYLIVHPDHKIVQTIAEEDLDHVNALLLYLKHEGLHQEVKPYLSMLKSNKTIDNSMNNISLQSENNSFLSPFL